MPARRYPIPLRAILCLAFLSLMVARPEKACAFWPFDEKGIDYKMQLDGVEGELADWLRRVSQLANEPAPPPKDVQELESIAGADVGRLRDALKARGYYDAEVEMRILPPGDGPAPPYIVQFGLHPGTRYTLGTTRLDWQGSYRYPVDRLAEIAPKPGEAAEAEKLQAFAEDLRKRLGNEFCLLRLKVTAAAELDHEKHILSPVYQLEAGPAATIGEIRVTGEKRAHASLVARQSKLKRGECYRQEQVEEGRRKLLSSQLYGQATITPAAAEPDADGSVPVEVKVTERKARTVRFGASYDTDIGPGATAKWEHRNLNGDALKATTDLTVSQRLQGLDAKAYQPDFLRPDQTLTGTFLLQQETTDAYDAQTTSLGLNLERPLWQKFTGGLGGGYRLSRVTRTDQKEIYGLLFTPLFVQYDGRNDTLNTTDGFYSRLSLTPYLDTLGSGANFLRTQFNAQQYLTAETWPLKPTLALRGVVGAISGASANNVPADLRFYSGGGGSVRGYAYQSIGPRLNGDPTGGNSWFEFSTELRLKFTESIGAALFVDGGSIQQDAWSDLGKDMLLGAGGGLRYYTPVGPLRLDVGVPLDKRAGIDSAYQLYVSLGQAF